MYVNINIMLQKDADKLKRKVQKMEKMVSEFNERISKELVEVQAILGTHTTRKRENSRKRSSGKQTNVLGDTALLSEGD